MVGSKIIRRKLTRISDKLNMALINWENNVMYSPKFWGCIYLLLIPFFGIVYTLLGSSSLETHYTPLTFGAWFWESLYFSVVTITTLGFGDMYPVTAGAKIIVVMESLAGVVAIGFFLNAIGYQRAKRDAEEESLERERIYHNTELHKLKRSYRILKDSLDEYLEIAITLTYPMEKRGSGMSLYFDPEFDFHNIGDLYLSSLRGRFPIMEPAIVSFGKSKKSLVASFMNLLNQVDVTLWKDLESAIVRLLNDFKRYDSQDALEYFLHTTLGNKPAHEVEANLVRKWEGKVDYHFSNAINIYVDLYNLLRSTIPLSFEIKQQMNAIVNSNSES